MESNEQGQIATSLVPAASVAAQSWWPPAHKLIIEAFLHKPENVTVFPPDWKRLADDQAAAAQGLASELGDRGHFAVMLENGQPIACGGVLPYRGDSWIEDAQSGKSDADIANSVGANSRGEGKILEWEVCCFCVLPLQRKKGISRRLLAFLEDFIKARGARRLYASYAEIETGAFWPRMGFEVIPGAGGMLKKGFQIDPAKEGLRGDVVFKMAVKLL